MRVVVLVRVDRRGVERLFYPILISRHMLATLLSGIVDVALASRLRGDGLRSRARIEGHDTHMSQGVKEWTRSRSSARARSSTVCCDTDVRCGDGIDGLRGGVMCSQSGQCRVGGAAWSEEDSTLACRKKTLRRFSFAGHVG